VTGKPSFALPSKKEKEYILILGTAVVTERWAARSSLLPARAMTTSGFAFLWSSLTQFIALENESEEVISKTTTAAWAPR